MIQHRQYDAFSASNRIVKDRQCASSRCQILIEIVAQVSPNAAPRQHPRLPVNVVAVNVVAVSVVERKPPAVGRIAFSRDERHASKSAIAARMGSGRGTFTSRA